MLSTNLVWLRKHYQYTQEEIAQQVGVSRQSVAKWESGESLPMEPEACRVQPFSQLH